MTSNDEEGQMYIGRHDHNLCHREGLGRYTCSGCKEYGVNMGFQCHVCADFILHEACTTLLDETFHPFYGQHRFQFRPSTRRRHYCDACGELVKGFVFKSRSAHLSLHPLCLALPEVLNYGGHNAHDLNLIIEKDRKYSCRQCEKKISNWIYKCKNTRCKMSIDFSCAKVDFLKLSDYGIATIAPRSRIKPVLEKLSKLSNGIVVVAGVVGAMLGLVRAGEGVADLVGGDNDDDDDEPDGDEAEAANDDDEPAGDGAETANDDDDNKAGH